MKKVSGGGFADIFAVDATFELEHVGNLNYYNFTETKGKVTRTLAVKIQRKE